MIEIQLRPYSLAGDDGDYPFNADLLVAASGVDWEECLKNLVYAINNDEVDDFNNELIIVK